MKRLDHDKLPCKFDHSWDEDVAGDGGSRMPMWDCEWFDKSPEDEAKAKLIENFIDNMPKTGCDKTCAGYTPVETFICKKHNTEYEYICEDCEGESELMQEQAEQKYLEINDG
jgi:hypothetical protein